MKRLGIVLACAAFAGLLFGAPLASAADAPKAETKKAQPVDVVLKGDAKCTECHDEADSPEQLAIGKTRHGTIADKRTPTCTSCHGDSELHRKEAGRGGKETPAVDVGFTKKSKTPVEERNKACLSCHQGGKRIHWQSGVHASRDVACADCHKMHTKDDKVRKAETQTEVCFNCHKEQRTQINRMSHHPIPEGKMSCSSCHDVHGDSPKMMARATTNETCYTCHMEKRGPFVHNHQPVTEDCSICHNPHGTNIANLLKARAPFLCHECHNTSGHPGALASLPVAGGTTSPGNLGTVARGCLNCHTNIHGGNSIDNAATVGRFRR